MSDTPVLHETAPGVWTLETRDETVRYEGEIEAVILRARAYCRAMRLAALTVEWEGEEDA